MRRAAVVAGTTAGALLPWLVFVAANGGVVPYFATALEFAIAAPAMLLLLFGCFELSQVFWRLQALQAAALCGKAHDAVPQRLGASSFFASSACRRCSWSCISIARRWPSSKLATEAASSGVSSPCAMAAITAACA